MVSKNHILAEIRRTCSENGGKPLGKGRFSAATGITQNDVFRHWARWGDACQEAGFTPNRLQVPHTDDDVLARYAELARELGKLPVRNEVNLAARNRSGFPWYSSFARFGSRTELAARFKQWSLSRNDTEVANLCDAYLARTRTSRFQEDANPTTLEPDGFVYLFQHGNRREFKIGLTNSVGRREYELSIQMPEKLRLVHTIRTDDPPGIEAYWHSRFREKRKGGEWFDLTAADVTAFKRRRFM